MCARSTGVRPIDRCALDRPVCARANVAARTVPGAPVWAFCPGYGSRMTGFGLLDASGGASDSSGALESGHVVANRAYWDGRAADFVEAGRSNWAADEPRWGIWGIPQAELPVIPDGVAGADVVELGCGTAYVSAWLARAGARPVGVDLSPEQLRTARELQREHDLEFPLILGDAERLPFADASFDLAISEYGAVVWCDPYRWIVEAARVLRPGGRLVFLRTGVLESLCEPQAGAASERLLRPLFGLHRLEWDDPDGLCIEFQLPHGEMIRLLRSCGFAVDALVEVQAPEGATTRHPYVTCEWARQWPSEEVWYVRRGW
jgi:SAM-dependent methyltransferase